MQLKAPDREASLEPCRRAKQERTLRLPRLQLGRPSNPAAPGCAELSELGDSRASCLLLQHFLLREDPRACSGRASGLSPRDLPAKGPSPSLQVPSFGAGWWSGEGALESCCISWARYSLSSLGFFICHGDSRASLTRRLWMRCQVHPTRCHGSPRPPSGAMTH